MNSRTQDTRNGTSKPESKTPTGRAEVRRDRAARAVVPAVRVLHARPPEGAPQLFISNTCFIMFDIHTTLVLDKSYCVVGSCGVSALQAETKIVLTTF